MKTIRDGIRKHLLAAAEAGGDEKDRTLGHSSEDVCPEVDHEI